MFKWFTLYGFTFGLYKLSLINSETFWIITFVILSGFTVVSEIYELLKENK